MTQAVGYKTTKGAKILVTGSSGLVGARLVEMLIERGAKEVIAFDVVAPDDELQRRFDTAVLQIKAKDGSVGKITTVVGNLTEKSTVVDACDGVDVVYHIAALVGPFHDRDKYMAVNYDGSMNILEGCKIHKVPRLVYSSSPSTRFTGDDICGVTEDELDFPKTFLQLYAESKAYAEQKISAACCPKLLTISVAPHQVYGPHDKLFLPNLLETAGTGRLRVFGKGYNKISVCYVDNYCHGLMCGADALYQGSPALGKFYICTDGPEQYFWKILNQAVIEMGFKDLFSKFHLPIWLLMGIAHLCDALGFVFNRKFKLNPFNVKMLTIHRYFSIKNSERDLNYKPVVSFEEAWPSTIQWFKQHWLPTFHKKHNTTSRSNDSSKCD